MAEEDMMNEKRLGNEAILRKDWLLAEIHYTKAIRLNDKHAPLFSNRAFAYLKMKQFSKAEIDASKAIRLEKAYVKAYHRRGLARLQLGYWEQANADFEIAYNLDPKISKESKLNLELIRSHQVDGGVELKAVTAGEPSLAIEWTNLPFTAVNCPPKENENLTPNVVQLPQSSPPNSKNPASTSYSFQSPATSYDFLRDWTVFRKHPTQLAQYFLSLDGKMLKQLFGPNLEGDHISELLSALSTLPDLRNSDSHLYDQLIQLSEVDRFDTAVMFLNENDANNLRALSKQCEGESRRQALLDTFNVS